MNLIKPLLLATVILSLSACGWMTPPKYDNNEYALLAQLSTNAQFLIDECQNATSAQKRLAHMQYDATQLATYAFYLPDNTEFFSIAAILSNDVNEFHSKYNNGGEPSVKYCELKTRVLLDKIDTAMETMGKLNG